MTASVTDDQLIEAACDASGAAHAPYSRLEVGAALLTTGGRIVTGCNVENASFGLTICAERGAVFRAIAEREREFTKIAIYSKPGVMPCGTASLGLLTANLHSKFFQAHRMPSRPPSIIP